MPVDEGVFGLESFFEKNANGHQFWPTRCIREAPTAVLEASVKRPKGASGLGCESRVALQRAVLQSSNA